MCSFISALTPGLCGGKHTPCRRSFEAWKVFCKEYGVERTTVREGQYLIDWRSTCKRSVQCEWSSKCTSRRTRTTKPQRAYCSMLCKQNLLVQRASFHYSQYVPEFPSPGIVALDPARSGFRHYVPQVISEAGNIRSRRVLRHCQLFIQLCMRRPYILHIVMILLRQWFQSLQ